MKKGSVHRTGPFLKFFCNLRKNGAYVIELTLVN